MISVQAAKEIIRSHVVGLPDKSFALNKAVGMTLAEDVYADNDFPRFEQAAMDGYAFRFDDWNGDLLEVTGEIQAGKVDPLSTGSKEAIRIFTGAPVPVGVDTVVMQEKVTVSDKLLNIQDFDLRKGSNVRPQGSEILKGALALRRGSKLTPGAIGLLAGIGVTEVKAIRKPRVAIIVTGKELRSPGEVLQHGQVFESNSFALSAALDQIGVSSESIQWVDDALEPLTAMIENTLPSVDMLLITGGVSTGDYDFVSAALERVGVEKVFHKVKQKPGKPLLFGKKNECIVFGLPGNPSSVLTCFYQYVLLAIQQMMALEHPFLQTMELPILADYSKKPGLVHFLKGKQADGGVFPLEAQESYKMKSFAQADCLIVLEEERTAYEKGEWVEVHVFP